MYLLITIIAALLVGLVLMILVQQTLGKPESTGEVAEEYTDPRMPRFQIVRRGYDIAAVDHYLAMLEKRSLEQSEGKETI